METQLRPVLDDEQAFTRALVISAEAHQGQRDLQGLPYILHPLNVAHRCVSLPAKTGALLHDVVEDTNWELEDLRQQGFSYLIVDTVDALTRRDGRLARDGHDETYEEFIGRTLTTPGAAGVLAREVKIADLTENLREDRPHPKAVSLRPRYLKALARFQAAEKLDSMPT